MLDEMYLWQCLGTARSPADVAISKEQLKGMYSGDRPPWATDLSNGVAKARYHGRLHHAATAELARCEEELPILMVEKVRLVRWIKHTSERLHAAIVLHARDTTQLAAGKLHLLKQFLMRLDQMSVEVQVCLVTIPAPTLSE